MRNSLCLVVILFVYTTNVLCQNPAAAYCEKLGYKYVIEKDSFKNEIGYCLLPDGKKVDEWDFYRGKQGQDFSYCKKKGYDITNKVEQHDGYTSSCAYCVQAAKGNKKVNSTMNVTANGDLQLDDFMEMNGDTIIKDRKKNVKSDTTSSSSPMLKSNSMLKSSTYLPQSFDWRNYNGHSYVGTVHDQGSCGSCYAFGSAACAEGAFNKANGLFDGNCVEFSESFIMWCLGSDPTYSNSFNGCNGNNGSPFNPLMAIANEGICLRNSFNPEYVTTKPESCTHWNDPKALFSGWNKVVCGDFEAIKNAIMNYGVVKASLWMISKDYTGGIVNDNAYAGCGTDCENAARDHAVAIVGWGNDQSLGLYWIVKNSWGSNWGENGYFRIAANLRHIYCAVAYLESNPCTFESINRREYSGIDVKSGENVSYVSSNSIRLNPETKIEQGSHFTANITSIALKSATEVYLTEDNSTRSFNDTVSLSNSAITMSTQVYPNPTMGIVLLKGLPSSRNEISVLNSNGVEIKNLGGFYDDAEVDLTGFPSGIYYIQVKTNTKYLLTKIIKH